MRVHAWRSASDYQSWPATGLGGRLQGGVVAVLCVQERELNAWRLWWDVDLCIAHQSSRPPSPPPPHASLANATVSTCPVGKRFFERGPHYASLKIDGRKPPIVRLLLKQRGVERFPVRFSLYTDSQLNAATDSHAMALGVLYHTVHVPWYNGMAIHVCSHGMVLYHALGNSPVVVFEQNCVQSSTS